MILNLEDLFQFMKKHAKEEPLIAEDIIISAPGISTDETNRMIEAFPTLPESYLNFIRTYDIKQIDLAGYEISVCSQKSNHFASEMILWNGATERRHPISKKHDLIYFGSDGFDIFW